MGKQAQTIELSTDLGINYIPCCKIVLMFFIRCCTLYGDFKALKFN